MPEWLTSQLDARERYIVVELENEDFAIQDTTTGEIISDNMGPVSFTWMTNAWIMCRVMNDRA